MGSKKNVKTNSCFSFGFKVCFSKQKQEIFLKCIPADGGLVLKVDTTFSDLLPSFVTLNFILFTSPTFILLKFSIDLKLKAKFELILVSNLTFISLFKIHYGTNN